MAGNVNVNDAHSLSYYIAAKQQAAFPSPNEWNSYAALAQIDLYNYYNDEREKMLVSVKSGESLYIPPVLANFVVYNYTPAYSGNVITQPNNYQYDLEFTCSPSVGVQNYIKKVDYNKWTTYLNSTIDTPTINNPIFLELPDTFITAPANLPNVAMTYLQQPVAPFWAYTLVNNRPVYDASNSVDFQFDETEIYRLVSRLLKYMGISIRDESLAQAAMEMIQGAS
jgi:hypothetical protein